MNRDKILGAIAFPAFMLTWAFGSMLALVQLQPVDAAERWLPGWDSPVMDDSRSARHALAAVPRLDDPASMRQFDQALVEASDVMSGRWQPVETGLERGAPTETASLPVRLQPEARMSEQTVDAPSVGAAPKPVGSAESASDNASVPEEITIDAVAAVRSVDRARDSSARTGGDPVVRKRPSRRTAPGLSREKAEARRALESGRFAEAYARLRPSVREARGDVEYLGLLALSAMRTGSRGEAVVIYQHLAAMEPDASRWRVGYALAQESLGLDASSVFREALALSDAGTEVRALLESKLADGGPEGFS